MCRKNPRWNKALLYRITIRWFPTKLESVMVLSSRMFFFSVTDPNDCSNLQLLQFPSRYLEWIMVAREQSLDPVFNLDLDARADSLTEEERREVLSVRTPSPWYPWPGTSHDIPQLEGCVTIFSSFDPQAFSLPRANRKLEPKTGLSLNYFLVLSISRGIMKSEK